MPSRPLPSAPAAGPPSLGARRLPSATVAPLLGSGDPQRLLDLGDDPRFGFEELLRYGLPAAQRGDREQSGRGRGLGRTGNARDHRAIAARGPDRLTGGGHQVLDEFLRRLARAEDRDRGLDQDRVAGDHVVNRLALLLGGDRFVLVAEQRVTPAGSERLQRVPGGAVLAYHVVEEGLQVRLSFACALAFLQLRA